MKNLQPRIEELQRLLQFARPRIVARDMQMKAARLPHTLRDQKGVKALGRAG
jgi:hypothetical protein